MKTLKADQNQAPIWSLIKIIQMAHWRYLDQFEFKLSYI